MESNFFKFVMWLNWFIIMLVLFIAFLNLVMGGGEVFDIGAIIESISPNWFASTGIGLCVGLSVLGAAWGIFTVATSILGAGVGAPRITNKMLISVVFCEVVAIYGVIMAIVFSTKLNSGASAEEMDSHAAHFTGHGIFWGGIAVGVCNLLSGVAIGINGSGTAIASAANDTLFVRTLIVQIFSSVIGLFGLIIGLLLANKLPQFGE
ncbi:hypothetical protein MKZ38_005506 [Zalerion maritima]|uniref:V-ATPase proteolipid subunit C-like domain-containing protein n=1 Tax=Zalerion maritima TaxID=339359 RepID=A0AAD5WX51_9PEZI|nr:hypothetical protein MKZ38_005506 [Zalerion maritima]